jgi:large subunit ribosomal protein L21
VDRIEAQVGSTVDLSVLLVGGNGDVSVGTPEVADAKVVAEVIEHGRSAKLLVFKYKNKTRYRRRHGHRQDFTRLQIKEIVTEAGRHTAEAEKPKRAPARRARKPKEEPPAEPAAEAIETPQAKAEQPEAAAAPEAPTAETVAETEAAPKPARRRTPRKAPDAAAETPSAEAEAPARTRRAPEARRSRKIVPKAAPVADESKMEVEEPAPEGSEPAEESE